MNHVYKRNGGFTLVEIAIVLVIIGLLLGGILKGQELVTNAKIKRMVNDINGITAAIYSYQDRYSALPGDDNSAAARWSGLCGGNGNGNGVIEGTWYSSSGSDESRKIWGQLRAAGLINGAKNNCKQPLHAFGGRIGIEDSYGGLYGTVICMEDVEGKIGEILDRQLDDGIINTGNVRGVRVTGSSTKWDIDAGTYHVCKKL